MNEQQSQLGAAVSKARGDVRSGEDIQKSINFLNQAANRIKDMTTTNPTPTRQETLETGFVCECCQRQMELRIDGKFCNECYHSRRAAVAGPRGDAKFIPPAEDALHVAICQAVQEHHRPTANAILRAVLNDYKPTQLTRTELIRVQQRNRSGDVTAVMVSPAAASSPAPVESERFPVSPTSSDYGVKEDDSMTKNYDDYRAGMLRAAEMARNEFKRAPEAAKSHDCVYMGGYEDACDHLSSVIAQAAVIDSVRIAGPQPDWQYHISLLLPEGIEDVTLLKIFQVVEHELRAAAPADNDALGLLRTAAVLCISGDGQPRVSLLFKELKDAQAVHQWLARLVHGESTTTTKGDR